MATKKKQRVYKVRVTKHDIQNGQASHSNYCPIGLALERTVRTENFEVGHEILEIDEASIEMPRKLKTFIKRFDAGKSVKPFQFELTLPKILPGGIRA